MINVRSYRLLQIYRTLSMNFELKHDCLRPLHLPKSKNTRIQKVFEYKVFTLDCGLKIFGHATKPGVSYSEFILCVKAKQIRNFLFRIHSFVCKRQIRIRYQKRSGFVMNLDTFALVYKQGLSCLILFVCVR